ncbi:MAG: hypothetical protein ACLFWD_06985 [Anaerolineales bacterium]
MNLPAILFGGILASTIGLLFHLIRGGSVRRMMLYLITGWIGFTVGHQLGTMTGTTLLRIGAINFLTAALGALLSLILLEILAPASSFKEGIGPGGPQEPLGRR